MDREDRRYDSPEFLKFCYPDGLLLYHQPDRHLAKTVKEVLLTQLKTVYPIVGTFVAAQSIERNLMALSPWMLEYGGMVGSSLCANDEFKKFLISTVQTEFGFNEAELRRLFPEDFAIDCYQASENGLYVPIGGFSIALHGATSEAIQAVIGERGISVIDVSILERLKKERLRRENTGPGGFVIIPPSQYQHIDCHISGFFAAGCVNLYVDSEYAEHAEELSALFGKDVPLVLETVPHEVALMGGLNLRYITTKEGKNIVLASKDGLYVPMESRLRANDYTIIYIPDQRQEGSGVKCRTQHIPWMLS